MQAETTRLIIHTGTGPNGARRQAATAEEQTRHPAQKRRRASRDRVGTVAIYGQNAADSPSNAAISEAAQMDAESPENMRAGRRRFAAQPQMNTSEPARAAGEATKHGNIKTKVGPKKGKVSLLAKQSRRRTLLAIRRSEKSGLSCGTGEVVVYGQETARPDSKREHDRAAAQIQSANSAADSPANTAQAADARPGGVAARQARRARRRANARRRAAKPRLTFGERLLRNSAIACALLLAMLAARNIDTPWTRAAVEGVERALTMKIDLDESLGRLSFVRDLMPESMLVFFDLSSESELAPPVDGEMDKSFDEQQPWVEFACEPGATVMAAESGTVVATTQLSGGGWGVMIEHDNGLESVCAYLLEPVVQAGERVERGQEIASSEAGRVYFEVRRDGNLIDPAELLGL